MSLDLETIKAEYEQVKSHPGDHDAMAAFVAQRVPEMLEATGKTADFEMALALTLEVCDKAKITMGGDIWDWFREFLEEHPTEEKAAHFIRRAVYGRSLE